MERLTEVNFIFGLRIVEGGLRGDLPRIAMERDAVDDVVLLLRL